MMSQHYQTGASTLRLIAGLKTICRTRILLLLTLVNPTLCQSDQGLIAIDGDIILGGLFPIHKKSETTENGCGTFNEIPGYQIMEAMLFSIDKINKDPKLLPNITLGAHVYDTCQSKTIATDCAKRFVEMTLRKSEAQLAGVVGALWSEVSAAVADFFRVFEIPQISYASTSVTLSNKEIYSYFLRTVAPNSFRAQATVDIIQKFEWRYVATVNSADNYATNGIKVFWKIAKEKRICIDSKEHLSSFPKRPDDYEKLMERLVKRSKESNVSVVVLFCNQIDTGNLLKAANLFQGTERFTWISSDGWADRLDVAEKAGDAALGALTIMTRRAEVYDEFKHYFTHLDWNDYPRKNKKYFQEFWESRFNCRPNGLNNPQQQTYNRSCQGNESLANVSVKFSHVRVVMNAVYAFAHALNNLQKELCPNQVGMCHAMSHFQRPRLLEHIKNVSFPDFYFNTTVKFDKNGEVNAMYDILNFRKEHGTEQFVRVATWDGQLVGEKMKGQLVLDNDIKWLKGSSSVPQSYCSRNCNLGAIRQPLISAHGKFDPDCCWHCKECERLQSVVNNSCKDGPVGWLPNANRTNWLKRQVLYPKWCSTPSIILVVVSLICLVITLATAAVYIVHNDNRIIKATGRDLSYVTLAGIGLCFILPFLYISKPNDPVCYTRTILTGLALATCYAPLFLKINRIYRIFISARSSVARPPFVTPCVQLLVTCGIISIQLMFTTLWLINKPVHATEKYYSDREELVLECKVDKLSFSGNLGYNLALMILCTIYAFKTRNFPKNFNESKFIGITMYITCGVWIAFFPFYFNTSHSFTQIYLISGACVIIGLVTLIGLFAHKVYIVFFVHDIGNDNLAGTVTDKHRAADKQVQTLGIEKETTMPHLVSSGAEQITSRQNNLDGISVAVDG